MDDIGLLVSSIVIVVELFIVCSSAPTTNSDENIVRRLTHYITHYEPLDYNIRSLQTEHHRTKREVDRLLALDMHAYGRTFKIRLKRDTNIFSPDLIVENNTNFIHIDISRTYRGQLEDDPDSSVHGLITTDGLFEGRIHTINEEFIVERASRYFKKEKSFHSVIYRLSSIRFDRLNSSLCRSDELHRKLRRSLSQQPHATSSPFLQRHLRRPPSPPPPLQPRDRRSWRPSPLHLFLDMTGTSRYEIDPLREKYSYAPHPHLNQRLIDPLKTTCTMYIQADHLFYQKFDSNEDLVIEQLTQHVQGVNEIYRKIDFDGNNSPDNINFIIKRIKVWTNPKAPGYKFAGNYGVETFLELLSEENFDAFCLAYMFTYRDFDGGTLGLAWTGDLQNAGGVCEKHGQYRGSSKSLNSGIVTILNYGKDVPPSVSHVTMAHEVGHNIGSQHDPETSECSPGGADGNYIMYARATSGDRPNNNKFSKCSTQSMAQVISAKAQGEHGCFIAATSAICGNGVVEENEECDCGWEDECDEECCHPQQSSSSDNLLITPCTRKPGAECSPSEGPCCREDCRLIGRSKVDRVCREPTKCKNASFCNGTSAVCPPSSNLPNKTKCDDDAVCFVGECTGSMCIAFDLEACQCPPFRDGDFRDPTLCRLCCKEPGEGKPCRSSFQWNEEPYSVPDLSLKPGAACYDYRGYCDVFLKCREVDPTGPLANLRHLLFSAESMRSIRHWFVVYWYMPIIVGTAFLAFLAILIKLCKKKSLSSNKENVTSSIVEQKQHHPNFKPSSILSWRQSKWIGNVRCPSTRVGNIRSSPEYSCNVQKGQKENSGRGWV